MPFHAGNGDLLLLDPTQPIGTGNPVVADTGLSVALSFYNQFATVVAGEVDSSMPAISNLHASLLVYLKAGQAYRLDLSAAGAHVPVAISSSSQSACQVLDLLQDYSNPLHSWVTLYNAADCPNGNFGLKQLQIIRLDAATADPGQTPAGFKAAKPLHNSTGAIVGFLSWEGDALYRRDDSFKNPHLIKNLVAGSTIMELVERSLSQYYLVFEENGSSNYELYRFDTASGKLTSLYQYAGSPGTLPFSYQQGEFIFDANNLYFVDGNAIMRLPYVGGSATLVFTSSSQIVSLQQTASRLIVNGADTSNTGMIAVEKSANDSNSGTLLGPSNGVVAPVHSDISGWVYLVGDTGARRVRDDGTGAVEIAGSYWGLGQLSGSVDFSSEYKPDHVSLMLSVRPDGATSFTGQLIDPTTGGVIRSLGTTPQEVYGFGLSGSGEFGPYQGVSLEMDRGSTHGGGPFDLDAYFIDTRVADSLQPVSILPGQDDFEAFKLCMPGC